MDNSRLVAHFEEVEKIGLEIQRQRSDMIALDKQRQVSRQASKSLSQMGDKSVWCCVGQTFLKLPRDVCEMRMKEDVKKCDKEIRELTVSLKKTVSKLDDVEHTDSLTGFNLEAMNQKS